MSLRHKIPFRTGELPVDNLGLEIYSLGPYGGVGFVYTQKAGFTYDEIKCDSDRVMGLDFSYNGCKVLTVYGVYMPYNNRTASQTQLYIDTECDNSSSSSYELQHALHMRSIMHCFVWRGVRGYLNILVVVIVKFEKLR